MARDEEKKSEPKPELQLYRNPGYKTNEIFEYKRLVLDTSQITNFDQTSFRTKNMRFNLFETLMVEELTDVFIEFLNVQNVMLFADSGNAQTASTGGGGDYATYLHTIESTPYILLKIDEFQNNMITTNYTNIQNEYIIPNTSYQINEMNPNDAQDIASSDIAKQNSFFMPMKNYYMCTLNPMKIRTLTISLGGVFEKNNDWVSTGNKFYFGNLQNTHSIALADYTPAYEIKLSCVIALTFRKRK